MIDPLFVHWHVDPVIFSIGPLEIRWYSLLFVSGFILGWYLFKWFFKREGKPVDKLLDPLLFTLMIATIVGSRLGHCIFYQPDYYFGSWQGFLEIFQPWKGGLASHGGAIGILFACWWYVAKYGKPNGFDLMWLLDRLVICICVCGALIRLGNFFNSEIYGNETSLPWGVIFARRGETVPKHPTQLYESLAYTLMAMFFWWIYWKKEEKLHRGWMFGVFLILLFGFRFLIEFIKMPQVEFEESMSLNMGQLLSIPFIIAGIVILVLSYKFKKAPMRVAPAATHYCPPPKKKK